MTPALAAFIAELVSMRRSQPVPPSEIGERILASRFRAAFSLRTLERWLDQHDWLMWPCMPTSNAFEEAIKRCGQPAHVDGAWDRGWWVPKHEAPHEPNVSAEQVAQLMLELSAIAGVEPVRNASQKLDNLVHAPVGEHELPQEPAEAPHDDREHDKQEQTKDEVHG